MTPQVIKKDVPVDKGDVVFISKSKMKDKKKKEKEKENCLFVI